ncbi:ABC transporter ATP-binding protein [Paenibacillus sp. GSMTC-2017]|uniref:ABC transporter ATP-binding protein n=1 Tax=Paenibacillus sp. GSMTC-2017 TaxID=2794350 RepID=UPI0018D872D1|nr:ABC transporter ATP-binding protein [Paenibacillus sp. GSMTC-2017]MBH5318371.1 ABC transporter ATP-binding protein [Paenibacillus sp. GSMTC-2017]
MGIILEAKELGKTYSTNLNQEQLILKGINVQINKGEFVSIMGPSGSGKSTLLYNISGMDKLSTGSVVFDGQEISSLSEEELSNLRLTKMGFIFQNIHLLKNLSIMDNIILTAYVAKNRSRADINKRAVEVMEKSGIAELASNDISQASGGQLQRVAICRALMNSPEILFGDEPTGALNSKSASEIMDIIADINESGTTILVVTHDVKVAAKSERILFMLDGSIAGELHLGKYKKDNGDNKIREEQLSNWLSEMGF